MEECFFNMAASEAEKYASSVIVITDSKLIDCLHMPINWKVVLRRGNVDKISKIGMDPLLFPLQNILPPVEASDLLSYETSFYTKDQFKNFRSLLAYNHMVSGFYYECSWPNHPR